MLLLWPYVLLRLLFLFTSRRLSFENFEISRGIMNFGESFTALAMFILGYIGKVDVVPNSDFFQGKNFVTLIYGGLMGLFFIHSILGFLFVIYSLTHLYLCITGTKLKQRSSRRTSHRTAE